MPIFALAALDGETVIHKQIISALKHRVRHFSAG